MRTVDLLSLSDLSGLTAGEVAEAAADLLDACALPHCGPALLHVAGLLADLGADDALVADVLERLALGPLRGIAALSDLAA